MHAHTMTSSSLEVGRKPGRTWLRDVTDVLLTAAVLLALAAVTLL